ncbi:hypothetical protein SOASR029_30290 [Budvicia aquatica]|nr:hypothetical protein SOASR029_30290 [Budvicia aquatica]
MPRAPGQIFRDPVTGVDTVHMGNGPVSQSDLDRLAWDNAKGTNVFHEAEAAAKLETTYGGTLERIPEAIDINGKTMSQADYIFTNGPMKDKTIDFMWTLEDPISIQKMNELFQGKRGQRLNEAQLMAHLDKADVVPLDYRNLSIDNQNLVNQWIIKLSPSQKS